MESISSINSLIEKYESGSSSALTVKNSNKDASAFVKELLLKLETVSASTAVPAQDASSGSAADSPAGISKVYKLIDEILALLTLEAAATPVSSSRQVSSSNPVTTSTNQAVTARPNDIDTLV